MDSSGQAITELTAAHGVITWTVHLANAKAAWHEFHGRFHPVTRLRNRDIQNTPEQPNARDALIIDPGKRSIAGRDVTGAAYQFDTGVYRGVPVALGELRTDAVGRLVVLGGLGRSASTKADNPVRNYANNDYWYDDTSDGPVHARITLLDGRTLEADVARVIVTPPKFTPDFENLTSLYEIVATASGQQPDEGRVSFSRDILPLLRRMSRYQWLNKTALRGHGPGKGGDFFQPDTLLQLASAAADCRPAREAVLSRIRNPNLPFDGQEAVAQANYNFMPQLAGDGGDPVSGDPKTWFRLTPQAYARLGAWAAGDFDADYHPTPETVRLRRTIETAVEETTPIDELPPAAVPAALTRAALWFCVGAPFYPGIEMTYIAEDPSMYSAPFRLRPDIAPGGITKYMAVPWQADFYECSVHWWPAQRPDDVIPEAAYRKVILREPALSGGDSAFPAEGVIFRWYASSGARGKLCIVLMTDADLIRAMRVTEPECFHALFARTRTSRRFKLASPSHGRPMPVVSAASTGFTADPVGEAWVAAGDAAVSLDPLSSRGISAAMLSGTHAGHAAHAYLSGTVAGLASYAATLQRVYAEHCATQRAFYQMEQRFSAAPFWRRRGVSRVYERASSEQGGLP